MNTSGIRPVAWTCVIKMNPVPSQMGMIAKPEQQIDQETLAQEFGVIVDLGPAVFYDELNKGHPPRCSVGDQVMIQRYTGQHFKGDDGEKYRIINDRDIIGVVGSETLKSI